MSSESYEKGIEVLRQLGHDSAELNSIDEELHDYTVENCFGTVWSRPGLSIRDRELITLAVLVALNRKDGMRPHLMNAPHVGISEREIRELIMHVMCYAGWPVGPDAMRVYKEVIATQ